MTKREKILQKMAQRTNFLNRFYGDPEGYSRWIESYLEFMRKLPRPLVRHHKKELGKQTLCHKDSGGRRLYVWEFGEFCVYVSDEMGVVLELDEEADHLLVWGKYLRRMGIPGDL